MYRVFIKLNDRWAGVGDYLTHSYANEVARRLMGQYLKTNESGATELDDGFLYHGIIEANGTEVEVRGVADGKGDK